MTKPDPPGQIGASAKRAFFARPAVQRLIAAERLMLRPLLAGMYGRFGIQVSATGLPADAMLLADSAVQAPLYLTFGAQQVHGDVRAERASLPIRSASVNLIVLWHSVELSTSPRQELARWADLLAPGGVLFVVYFKARSLWALAGRFNPSLRNPGRRLSLGTVYRAMHGAGLHPLFERSCYYRPPSARHDRLAILERMGRWLPLSAASGVAVGQRKVEGMTVIPIRKRISVRAGMLAESLAGSQFESNRKTTHCANSRGCGIG